MSRRTPAWLPIAVTIATLTAGAAWSIPAVAASPTTGVTVFLRGPDNAALQQLANAHGLTHAQRVRALSQLLPTAKEHAAAASALRAEGLTVTDQNAWSVSASAPETTVAHVFGVHAVAQAHATPAEQAAATGPYPGLPASLSDVATAVYPTSGGPAAFHPEDDSCEGCLGGTDFRNAYDSPTTQPPTGQDSAATLTIASIQLSGWNPGDLTNWADTPGNDSVPFNETDDLTQVPIDQSSVPPAPNDKDDSDVEVDLDQESLLSTDPYAHQRPYFTPNTNAGIADAFSQIVDDVLQDSHAYQGGDPHIVAVTDSWGVCEADEGTQNIQTLEPILTSLVAAGVTIFTSSGDQGVYDDCSGAETDVDYPSASPEAVAVGGTNLSPVGASAPNTGSNWNEVAWSCTSAFGCNQGSGGSGGGISQVFGKPAYQSKITNQPFSNAVNRLVPDISADGDPDTGFRIYTSDPTDTANGASNYIQIGGTSLAAPESAALFTDAIAAHSVTAGIGDIHQGLYNAYAANVGAFRDIIQGSNGAAVDATGDPSVNAGIGYDTVTGLGAPLWPAVAPYLFAAEPPPLPKATAALTLAHPFSPKLATQVSATWTTTVPTGGLALKGVSVTVTRSGQQTAVYANASAPMSGSYTFTGVAGATYNVTVVATDLAGNNSRPATSTLPVPIDDKAFHYNGQWHRTSNAGYYAGSAEFTNRRNSYATATATGTSYSLFVRTGPSFGRLRIAWNGFTLMTVSLYSAKPGSRAIDYFDSGTRQSRTFRFTVLGTSAYAASGANIGLDGLIVGY
jgi:hypothetical protein